MTAEISADSAKAKVVRSMLAFLAVFGGLVIFTIAMLSGISVVLSLLL